jgi:adenosine deaminase
MTFLPLADLHRHLDGSLRPSTLHELATRQSLMVPRDLPFQVGMGLDAALGRFAFMLSLLQSADAVRRIAKEMCEDAREENVTTLEIRFAPQLHRGASMSEIVDAALEGIAGRAGLILCGLYGESPDVLMQLVDIAETRQGVVGIDLAGGPSPTHSFGMDDYAPAYSRAKDLGIGRTVHAGEGRPPSEIRDAIELLHAQRIGHGTTLLDDPTVANLVIERGIIIEACPTSNVHTGVIASVEAHPLVKWLDRGVRVCVNADNTFLSGVNARDEYENVRRIDGMDEAKWRKLVETGHQGAFRRA